MNKKGNIKRLKFPLIFWLSVIASVIVILVSFFRWKLVDILTPFIEPILELIVFVFFLVAILWSLIFGLLKIKSQKTRAFVPLSINLVTLLIVLLVPFTALTLKMDFHFNINKREQVVEKIKNCELAPNVSHNDKLINLPTGYKHLSKGGGDVIVEYENKNPNVFFFTFRGILDNFSGFVYRADNNQPRNYDFGCEHVELEKLKDHWYWMSCT